MQISWFELPLELMFTLLNDMIHKPYSKGSCNCSFRYYPLDQTASLKNDRFSQELSVISCSL